MHQLVKKLNIMSNISKEMQQMFFYNVKEDMRNDKTRGMGHVLVDGSRLKHVVVPKITNMKKMNLLLIIMEKNMRFLLLVLKKCLLGH